MAETNASVRPDPVFLTKLLPLSKPSSNSRISILCYGAPGVGKTVLAGTAEDDERSAPVLYIDAEQGVESISQRGDRLDVFNVNNIDQLSALNDYFWQGNKLRKDIPYKSLVFDSLTELGWLTMQGITSSDAPERGDWQKYSNQMRNLVTALRELPFHLIVTAQEKVTDDTGSIGPLLNGSIINSLPGFFNTFARLSTATMQDPEDTRRKVTVRRLTLQSSGKVAAKDRMDKLGTMESEMLNPTMSKLLDRLEEGQRQARAAHKAFSFGKAKEEQSASPLTLVPNVPSTPSTPSVPTAPATNKAVNSKS